MMGSRDFSAGRTLVMAHVAAAATAGYSGGEMLQFAVALALIAAVLVWIGNQ